MFFVQYSRDMLILYPSCVDQKKTKYVHVYIKLVVKEIQTLNRIIVIFLFENTVFFSLLSLHIFDFCSEKKEFFLCDFLPRIGQRSGRGI